MSAFLPEAPPGARACYVFAHGAGAGMNHSFMLDVSQWRMSAPSCAYTDKQKRQAEHIEQGCENRGVGKEAAESWRQ